VLILKAPWKMAHFVWSKTSWVQFNFDYHFISSQKSRRELCIVEHCEYVASCSDFFLWLTRSVVLVLLKFIFKCACYKKIIDSDFLSEALTTTFSYFVLG